MKGGLSGEDSVTWKKDEVSTTDQVSVKNNNNNKEKEATTVETNTQKISSRQISCLLGVILVFSLSLTGTIIMWGTNMIEDTVDQMLLLKNGTTAFEKWANSQIPNILTFRLFNYTNVEAFERGKDPKLKVVEAGPYVFRETTKRVNIVFNGNGTLTYQLERKLEFLAERSAGTMEDMVVSINIPLMAMHHQAMSELNYFQRIGASLALKTTGVQPFVKRPAHELFFGYKDMLTAMAEFKVPDVKVGFLQEKVGVSPDKVTMYTGETDFSRLAIMSHYNGLEQMDFYSASECNRVDGSDGCKFPPTSIYPGSTIYVYERDACRRIPLVYNGTAEIWDGMPLLRFNPPTNVFDNGEDNPDNNCYCKNDCQLSGVTNIAHCKNGAPVFVSFPHFLHGDPRLLEAVEGLKPDPEKHQLYLNIHQRVGAPLFVMSRIQLNVLMTNGLMYDIVSKVDGQLLPTFWMQRELDEFPEDVRDILEKITFTLPVVKAVLSYACPLLMIITGIVLLICAYIEIAALLRKDPPSYVASETCITRL